MGNAHILLPYADYIIYTTEIVCNFWNNCIGTSDTSSFVVSYNGQNIAGIEVE